MAESLLPGPPDTETFFAAQRRHRRAARLIAALAAVAAAGQSLLVALMVAPLTFAVLLVGLDVVNLRVATPDLVAQWERDPRPVLALLVAAGAAGIFALWAVLRARLRAGLAGAALAGGCWPPDPGDPEQHRLANVVAEAALAAGIAPPRLLVVPSGVNVAAFGTTEDDATLVVPRTLLDRLDRRRTAAVVAQQVAAVANGDLRVRHAVEALPVAWAVPARLMGHPFSRATWGMAWSALLLLLGRLDPAGEARLLDDLLTRSEREIDEQPDGDLAAFAGIVPVMVHVAWGAMRLIADVFVVGPLLAVWVRRRVYLADATAVQLTRDPDGLAQGLVQLVAGKGEMPGTGAVDLACAVAPRPDDATDGPLGALSGGWHPPTRQRLRRLEALGHRPGDAARHAADEVLARGEPRPWGTPGRHAGERRDVTAGRVGSLLRGAVLTVVLLPLVALVLVLLAALVVVLLTLSFFPVAMFYLLPVLLVVLPLHAALRAAA